ncbi:MAG TPA: AMP-binding protein, partial [Kofleriaceae bacterium]|nr:AMP-binding protein [Kofleriaceae bacterium]
DRPAIITHERVWTFGECARLAKTPGSTLPATTEIATILRIYGALEAERPVGMVHPKLPFAEQARQRTAVETATLPAGTAFILFTSGSTGPARGVVLSRNAIIAAALASEARLGWRADDAWLLALPLAHAGGLAIVVRGLVARKPIVLVQRDSDLAEMLPRATLASFVPAQLAELVEHAPPPKLRAVILGGAAAPPALLERARAWPVLASYGLTETFGQIATAREPGGPLELLPGVEVTCEDTIEIRAPQLATQYLDGTPIAPRFVTADLGVLDGDTLRILGRRDDVIITGGEKVQPSDVEAVLTATPGIAAACVFGVPNERWGNIVAAAIVRAPGFVRADVLAHWHAHLAPHARPRGLVELAKLPLLPSGKLDRRAIAAMATAAVDYA